jgi:hypothetical protein
MKRLFIQIQLTATTKQQKEVIKFLKDYSGSVDLENLIAFPIAEVRR